jgi:hypothetical protein
MLMLGALAQGSLLFRQREADDLTAIAQQALAQRIVDRLPNDYASARGMASLASC